MGDDFYVILHNIRSCYNVGSVFRTSDAFRIDKIILGGYTPDPEKNKSIKKTALGADDFVTWEKVWQTHKIIKDLKGRGFKIVALEQAEKSKKLSNFKPKFPLALILGNEVKGLSEKILEKVDEVIEIPMGGEKESLNVSVAFGIAAWNIKMGKLNAENTKKK